MSGLSFIQGDELFRFSATHCLRNDYIYNDCTNCIDICPENAFHIVRNKLTLFENECIACSACLGSCPTEALSMKSFDPNNYVVSFTNEKMISCKDDSSCLASFDAHHYITMALESEGNMCCDLSHCLECNLNRELRVEHFIRHQIEVSNAFFYETSLESKITINEKLLESEGTDINENVPERRLFFKQLVHPDDTQEKYESLTELNRTKTPTQVPLKVKKFQESLQKQILSIEKRKLESKSELFFNKSIEFTKCTNCADCTQFCPTGALFNADDKLAIVFTPSKCIDCNICEDICKTDAITATNTHDIVEFAYGRSRELVRFEMVMCAECRCPYPYRGGDPICDRCVSFTNEMPNMFTLAKDM